MLAKTKKQFGIWMDSRYAIVVGHKDANAEEISVIGQVTNEGAAPNTNENTENNHEKTMLNKFFKEIASHMQNAEEVHVTGTGIAQEQFIKFLSETPQFKNTKATESTSTKMGNDALLEYITEKFA